jgi:HlyD family secretion protein
VIIALTEAPEHWTTLGDGYRVEAQLVLWHSESVLQVPRGAIFRRGEGWSTFRVEQGVAHLVNVKIGHRGQRAVEVVSGLLNGDMLAMHPGERVDDGARVTQGNR